MNHNGAAPSKTGEDLDGVFEGLSTEQLRAFLTPELRRDVQMRRRFLSRFGRRGTTSRAEFRAEIEAAYAQIDDAGHYWAELRFDDFFDAAEASVGRGDYDEALWMYQEISEAISDHMEDVDDSYGHYALHHDMALKGMVDCMRRLDLGHEQKRRYISYMYDRIIQDDYGLGPQYADSLAEMCTDGPDARYLSELRLRGGGSVSHRTEKILDKVCGSRGRTA